MNFIIGAPDLSADAYSGSWIWTNFPVYKSSIKKLYYFCSVILIICVPEQGSYRFFNRTYYAFCGLSLCESGVARLPPSESQVDRGMP